MNLLDPQTIAPWFIKVVGSLGLSAFWTQLIWDVIGSVSLVLFAIVSILFIVWLERKFAARVQDRLGPNRVGPYGLLQTIADTIKLLTKEDITPATADRVSYNIAPILAVFSVFMVMVVIPFAKGVSGADLNVGVLYITAVSSLGIMAALMAGWSSDNKYALIGGFRVVAQLLSYEVPMVMAMVSVVLVSGSMSLQKIVGAQAGGRWFFWVMPAVFLLYLTTAFAENERTPFDLLEADSEIVAGYHIEYGGIKFAWFFLTFFLNTLFLASFAATFFLGGWRGPFAEQVPILGFVYYFLKTTLVIFFMMWVRATWPRLRIDQMMSFAWKVLVPTSLVLVMITAIILKLGLSPFWETGLLLISNLAVILVVLGFLGRALRLGIERPKRRVVA